MSGAGGAARAVQREQQQQQLVEAVRILGNRFCSLRRGECAGCSSKWSRSRPSDDRVQQCRAPRAWTAGQQTGWSTLCYCTA